MAGFGISPVLLAPIAAWCLKLFASTDVSGALVNGVSATMIALEVFTCLVVGVLAQFIRNPLEGFVARRSASRPALPPGAEFDTRAMLATAQFWLLYIMYFCRASAGLMFISVAQDLGKRALGEWAFFAVVVVSAGNTGGRILAGVISDRIGRQWTLFTEFVCQALVVAVLFWLTRHGGGGWAVILVVVFLLGMNYGANLAIFPSACKDYFGIRNFGLNYGWMFTAFGSAGLVMPWVHGRIRDVTDSSDTAYIIILIMMTLSAILAVVSRFLGAPALQSSKIG